MSEIRIQLANKQLRIEADSNSMATLLNTATSLLMEIERRADKLDESTLSAESRRQLLFLRERLQMIEEDTSEIDRNSDEEDFFHADVE